MISLSPVWGLEVLMTPKPQASWFVFVQKLRTPGPIRIAGSTKPGLWQHSSPNGQFTLLPEASSQPPWMSAHLPIAPHWMHTVCSHAGGLPSVTVKVVVAVGVGAEVVVGGVVVVVGGVVVVLVVGGWVVVGVEGAVVVDGGGVVVEVEAVVVVVGGLVAVEVEAVVVVVGG